MQLINEQIMLNFVALDDVDDKSQSTPGVPYLLVESAVSRYPVVS
jgi:hypothetical protein